MTGTEIEILPPATETRWVELRNPALELAREIADTQFVPKGLRGNPPAIAACILYGDEIGLGPMQALTHIAVIDGRPSLSAELMRALVQRAGHRLWLVEATNTKVTAAGRRAGEQEISTVTWTMDDARRARLDAKDNWRAYPRAMLTARATAELARTLFADVLGGMAATEELVEPTDGSGPDTLPSEPAGSTTRRRRRAQIAPPAPAAPDATITDPVAGDTVEPASPDQSNGQPDLPPLPNELEPETGADAIEAAEQTIAAEAAAAATETELLTDAQRRKMNALFRELGVTGREPRLAYCTTVAERPISTSSELTVEEAGRVIDHLEAWKAKPEAGPFQDGIPDEEGHPMNDQQSLLEQARAAATDTDDGDWGYRLILDERSGFEGRYRGRTVKTGGDYGDQDVLLLWDPDGAHCYFYAKPALARQLDQQAPSEGDNVALYRDSDAELSGGRTKHRIGLATRPSFDALPAAPEAAARYQPPEDDDVPW